MQVFSSARGKRSLAISFSVARKKTGESCGGVRFPLDREPRPKVFWGPHRPKNPAGTTCGVCATEKNFARGVVGGRGRRGNKKKKKQNKKKKNKIEKKNNKKINKK